MWTVAQLGADLKAGRTSSRELVEQALARIGEQSGEGARAFLKVYADAARAEAAHADRLRKAGVRRSAVDGLPVSLKDLDVTNHHSIRLRIGVKENAKNPGGVNIFGCGFGNRASCAYARRKRPSAPDRSSMSESPCKTSSCRSNFTAGSAPPPEPAPAARSMIRLIECAIDLIGVSELLIS